MMTQAKIIRGAARWQGGLDAKLLPAEIVAAGNRLADFAKAGDWSEVFMVLEDEKKWVVPYQWRPGGKSWFTVLHQAAWHGPPLQVVDKLLKRGASPRLRDAKGRIPFDVAAERGHSHLLQRLEPPQPPLSSVNPGLLDQLDLRLGELIYGRLCPLLVDVDNFEEPPDWPRMLRYPPVEILPEFPKQQVWFPMILIDAGFRITLHQGFLEVIMWNNEFKGSGLAHVVTADAIIVVDEGFI